MIPVLRDATRGADAPATFRVIHEDDDIVVVDKPAGLLTSAHPDSGRPNLCDALARRSGPAAASCGKVRVVHRLDLATSGVLVLAKGDLANRVLSNAFRDHALRREYLAAVRGAFPDQQRRLDSAVKSKPAVTLVEVIERFERKATLVRCRLETGRTHQIRVHLRRAHHWVLGDPRRGQRTAIEPPRMALHAALLAIAHPRTGAPLTFEAPWPDDLGDWLAGLRA